MATAANPMMQQVMAALAQRSASGTGAPGQSGPAGGDPSGGGAPGGGDDAGAAYAQQVSQLKGADPGQLLEQVKKLKQLTAVMLVQNLERLPNVSGKLSKMIPMWDGVLKEIMQAQNVNQAVRNPVQMGAAQPQQPDGQSTAPSF
jgi:hypothetical protein